MVHYKLHYFDVAGRAEPIRLLFHWAGQPFEDYRFKKVEWPALKSRYPFQQVPVLEVDGQMLAQSAAIGQYLGKQFGLAGSSDWEQAKAAELVDYAWQDFGAEIASYLDAKLGFRPGNVDQLYAKAFLPAVRKYCAQLERTLDASGSGFLLPFGLTYADFFCASLLALLRQMEPQAMEAYTALSEYVARFHSLPRLSDYPNKK